MHGAAAVHAEVAIAEIVNHHEDDVRLFLLATAGEIHCKATALAAIKSASNRFTSCSYVE